MTINKGRRNFFSILFSYKIIVFTIGCMVVSTSTYALSFTLQVEPKAITNELVDYVAEIGKDKAVDIKKGQTLQDVIEAHCGQFNVRYLNVLKRGMIEGLPSQMTKNAKIEADQSILLPECIRTTQFVVKTKKVNPGDAPLKYYKKDNAGFINESAYLDKFKKLNQGFDSVTNQIKVGEKVDVPVSTLSWSSIDVDLLATNNSKGDIEEHVVKLLNNGGQAEVKREGYEEFQPYSQLNEQEIKEKGWCKQPENGIAIASFDPVELGNVVSYNLGALHSLTGRKVGHLSNVIIADTGLYTTESTPFSKIRIANHYFPPLTFLGLDPKKEPAEPIWKYSKHQHGTYVASQVFGGARFLEMLDSNLDIRLAPLNIFVKNPDICVTRGIPNECDTYKVGIDVFNSLFEIAEEKSAIVNISLGREKKLSGLKVYLSDKHHALYVVAAGNDSRDLIIRDVFPAKYGGKNINLITVASINQTGELAGFSNHGPNYVDIAAPGCLQEVFMFEKNSNSFRRTRVSGTSLSTPLVSFTAAMIKSLWLNDTTPLFIKHRILIGADIKKSLMGAVKDGRILNVVKAVSLYQDIIEANINGKKRLIRGKINNKHNEFSFCGQTFYRKAGPGEVRVIKKLAIVEDDIISDKKNILVYSLVDNVLRRKPCSFEEFTLSIQDGFTGQTFELGSKDIIDVVFAEKF